MEVNNRHIGFDSLPLELTAIILDLLPFNDQLIVQRVCGIWKRLINEGSVDGYYIGTKKGLYLDPIIYIPLFRIGFFISGIEGPFKPHEEVKFIKSIKELIKVCQYCLKEIVDEEPDSVEIPKELLFRSFCLKKKKLNLLRKIRKNFGVFWKTKMNDKSLITAQILNKIKLNNTKIDCQKNDGEWVSAWIYIKGKKLKEKEIFIRDLNIFVDSSGEIGKSENPQNSFSNLPTKLFPIQIDKTDVDLLLDYFQNEEDLKVIKNDVGELFKSFIKQ